jgi:hypothetical protein
MYFASGFNAELRYVRHSVIRFASPLLPGENEETRNENTVG